MQIRIRRRGSLWYAILISISSGELTEDRGFLRLKLSREMDVRRQPITWPFSSCHITPGGCKLLGVHQGWHLNSTVVYHLVKHPAKIRAAVPALAPGTFTNVWAETENNDVLRIPYTVCSHWTSVNYQTYLLTYSMVQSPSWAADWFAASQEIPRISRNPKVH